MHLYCFCNQCYVSYKNDIESLQYCAGDSTSPNIILNPTHTIKCIKVWTNELKNLPNIDLLERFICHWYSCSSKYPFSSLLTLRVLILYHNFELNILFLFCVMCLFLSYSQFLWFGCTNTVLVRWFNLWCVVMYPAGTERCFNIYTMFFKRYGR